MKNKKDLREELAVILDTLTGKGYQLDQIAKELGTYPRKLSWIKTKRWEYNISLIAIIPLLDKAKKLTLWN